MSIAGKQYGDGVKFNWKKRKNKLLGSSLSFEERINGVDVFSHLFFFFFLFCADSIPLENFKSHATKFPIPVYSTILINHLNPFFKQERNEQQPLPRGGTPRLKACSPRTARLCVEHRVEQLKRRTSQLPSVNFSAIVQFSRVLSAVPWRVPRCPVKSMIIGIGGEKFPIRVAIRGRLDN